MKKVSIFKLKAGNIKMKITLATVLVVAAFHTYAQTQTNNYIRTQTPRISGITNDSLMAVNNTDKTKVQIAIQYVDGLGRPIQTIQKQGSPLGYDMISPQAYDAYGREVKKYLTYTPQTGTAGSYRPNAVSSDQRTFYATPPSGSGVTAITDPYAQTIFDNSPLSRTLEQGAPGVPWQPAATVADSGHTVKMVYKTNNDTLFSADSIKGRRVANYYVTIDSTNKRTLHNNSYYAANTLTVTISKDENWVSGRAGTVEEYKDIDGQVILKRAYNYKSGAVEMLSTYYVYDDLGKLAFVLPPLSGADGAVAISDTTLNNLCYQYGYDERERPIAKKIPGKGWEYTVYNTMDIPVATQDSLQRANKQWIFTKYDALNRPIWTGIWNNGGTAISRASLQTTLNGISSNLYEATGSSGNGYTNVAWPTTNVTATLTLDYYDGYSVPGTPTKYILASGVSKLTRGQPTAKKTAVLNTPTNQLWDVMYYDDLGRSIKTYAQHYLGGTLDTNNYDLTSITYNFTNQQTTTSRQHWNTASTLNPLVTIANTYLYDHMGRKLKTWEQIQNGNSTPTTKTLVSKIDYNEIGQVSNKHLHSLDSTTFLQNIPYTYNERGWLLTSGAALFSMRLYYNTSITPQYNGNIAQQYWGVSGNLNNHYNYIYDRLNRLLSGGATTGASENPVTYDLHGNITSLKRFQNSVVIDNLGYLYTGNQLTRVNDVTSSNTGMPAGLTYYTYDGNGNMLTDTNSVNTAQNKTFTYNLLNLPQTVKVAHGQLTYTYDAAGNKLRKVSVISGVTHTTDYISGIEYDGGTTDTLNFIQTEEGKVAKLGASYDYTYYLGDNLGNTRITFGTKTGTAIVYQKNDYYPFGMLAKDSVAVGRNEYLYNKKELQEETQEYDYGARYYDPVIARWITIDPLTEKSRRLTPYSYALNNPPRMIDPDGMRSKDSIAMDENNWATLRASFGMSSNSITANYSNSETSTDDNTPEQNQGTNNESSTKEEDKPRNGITVTHRTLGPLVSKLTDYYYQTIQPFTQTVVGEEGSESTTNLTYVGNKFEGSDFTKHGVGITSGGDVLYTKTVGNVTTTYILQHASVAVEISTTVNGISTGTITTTYPRVRRGFVSFSKSFEGLIEQGLRTIFPPQDNKKNPFLPLPGQKIPFPIPEP
ncbi:RHS repeat-associated core domain-containing protein [Mucilaginibacter ginsenosidivorans]|uniref:RHS repeat-associated core domain-containing protein n=2 Tax=Mucilaginibacter ginsenosidivorans TaxID=398053 RepID=A0A5B8UTG8_9SPHI|nr:RHS repeat-associated core domain-containing protein [Mucilaginibacter ginsenosidivorans]